MDKKIINFSIVVAICLALTGCVRGNLHAKINNDGSADLEYKVAMNNTARIIMSDKDGSPIERWRKETEKEGFQTSTFKDGTYVGVQGKKHFNRAEDLKKEDVIGGLLKKSDTDQLIKKEGLFYDIYILKANVNLSNEKAAKEAISDNSKVSSSDPFSSMLADNIDLKFALTLPVDAEHSNASRVTGGKMKTYEWDLIFGEQNKIDLQMKVPNIRNIILAILGGLIIIGLVSYLIWRKRNGGKLILGNG